MRGVHYTNAIFTCSWWMVRQYRFSVFVMAAQEGSFNVMVFGRATQIFFRVRGRRNSGQMQLDFVCCSAFLKIFVACCNKYNRHFFVLEAPCAHKISPSKQEELSWWVVSISLGSWLCASWLSSVASGAKLMDRVRNWDSLNSIPLNSNTWVLPRFTWF